MWDRILDDAGCISLHSNDCEKSMNTLTLEMARIDQKMATGLGVIKKISNQLLCT